MNEKELINRRQNAFLICVEESRSKIVWRYRDWQYSASFGHVMVGVWLNPDRVTLEQSVIVHCSMDLMSIAQELMAAELFILNIREKFRMIDEEAKD